MKKTLAIALLLPVTFLTLSAQDSAPAAGSSDLNNLDLRIRLGGGGGITTVTDDASDTDTDYESTGGAHVSVNVLYLRARPGGVGFAVGGGLFTHAYAGEPENGAIKPESTVNASGLEFTAAFVYRPTHRWHFELPAVVISGGSAEVETDGAADSDVGGYGRFALQVGAYYTFGFGLQLGADVGAQGFAATVEREVSPGVNQEYTYSGGGGFITLNVGYRF
jgi:hypothetical protein